MPMNLKQGLYRYIKNRDFTDIFKLGIIPKDLKQGLYR